jgi:hypothetical protein
MAGVIKVSAAWNATQQYGRILIQRAVPGKSRVDGKNKHRMSIHVAADAVNE